MENEEEIYKLTVQSFQTCTVMIRLVKIQSVNQQIKSL